MEPISQSFTHSKNKTTHYLSLGPPDGPLLIFVHGWPGAAITWKPQLLTFASLGFYCIAADTAGYGLSSNTRNVRDYSCESLVADQLALLSHLKRPAAIWIGHDWGSGIVWSLAANHPNVCLGVVNLAVPYRMLELGLSELLSSINRSIYPGSEYPNGQWDYQVFYEEDGDKATSFLDSNVSSVLKVLFARGSPTTYGQPARTSTFTKDGGWFGGGPHPPDIPLAATCLDEGLHAKLVADITRNGFWGPTAYYLNHDVNRPYNLKAPNNGRLDMPVLFIHAAYDGVCATTGTLAPKLVEPQRRLCKDLSEVTVDAGHWVALEKPAEVNAALARWLCEKVKGSWPGYWERPMMQSAGSGKGQKL